MGEPIRKLWIGLDWGTHSSKWWYSAEDQKGNPIDIAKVDPVVESTVYRTADRLILVRERTVLKSDVEDARLKRLLLKDPQGASYWDAIREGIGISLGDAATLSLAVLLGDVESHLISKGLAVSKETAVELRFSLPNWISADKDHRAARRRMFQTAAVVSLLVDQRGLASLPRVGEEVEISKWRGVVCAIRALPAFQTFAQLEPSFAELVGSGLSSGQVSWRLAAESSAAGFPPLLDLLLPEEEAHGPQDHWVKLLVIDVGAGSTDAGYFISSRKSNGELLLQYLKPATTFDYAGEQLTEMLKEHYLRDKNREITIQEAETVKLSAPEEWKDLQFAQDWRARISRAVGEYMFHVPDDLRLGESAIPGLKIILTGGSGLVNGLGQGIETTVAEALARRGVSGAVANRSKVFPLSSDRSMDPIERSRRAVSIGAGAKNFALLRYCEQLPAATLGGHRIGGWRG